jgi:hypothetical protein
MRGIIPIHLVDEGYTNFPVYYDGVRNADALAYVDEAEDWVVRVDLFVYDEDALYDLTVHELSVFGVRTDGAVEKRDLIVKSKLIILPVDIPAEGGIK